MTLYWLQEFCESCSFDKSVDKHIDHRLLFLLTGKLGQLTKEKFKSIRATVVTWPSILKGSNSK